MEEAILEPQAIPSACQGSAELGKVQGDVIFCTTKGTTRLRVAIVWLMSRIRVRVRVRGGITSYDFTLHFL